MWKSDLIVLSKRIVFHNPCGNRCGKLLLSVEIQSFSKVFHISTAPRIIGPVEMWKTPRQVLFLKGLAEKRTVENF
jgi:hypothetical protein